MAAVGSLLHQPRRVYSVLAPVLVVSFLLSGLGGGNGGTTDDDGTLKLVGTAGWVVFGLALVATLAYSAAFGLHRLRSRRRT